MNRLVDIRNRLRSEFFSPDRGDEYSQLLGDARARGYEIRSLESVWSDVEGTHLSIALRHDVDRPATRPAREVFSREKSAGVKSTFYFRLKDFPHNEALVGELLDAGFDVGYHYEEAAAIAKELALRSRQELGKHGPRISDQFRANVALIRDRYHPGMRSVSSHGEWVNSRLGFPNHEFVSEELLAECGLWFEAYHPRFTQESSYVSDVARYPERWTDGYSLVVAMDAGHARICVLTHPERWFRAPTVNAAYLVRRGLDEIRYWARAGITARHRT